MDGPEDEGTTLSSVVVVVVVVAVVVVMVVVGVAVVARPLAPLFHMKVTNPVSASSVLLLSQVLLSRQIPPGLPSEALCLTYLNCAQLHHFLCSSWQASTHAFSETSLRGPSPSFSNLTVKPFDCVNHLSIPPLLYGRSGL